MSHFMMGTYSLHIHQALAVYEISASISQDVRSRPRAPYLEK